MDRVLEVLEGRFFRMLAAKKVAATEERVKALVPRM